MSSLRREPDVAGDPSMNSSVGMRILGISSSMLHEINAVENDNSRTPPTRPVWRGRPRPCALPIRGRGILARAASCGVPEIRRTSAATEMRGKPFTSDANPFICRRRCGAAEPFAEKLDFPLVLKGRGFQPRRRRRLRLGVFQPWGGPFHPAARTLYSRGRCSTAEAVRFQIGRKLIPQTCGTRH